MLIDHPASDQPASPPSARTPVLAASVGQIALAFASVLLMCYLVYGTVPITFTRTESGRMLEAAQQWISIRAMFWRLSMHSYHGHYVPLFFLWEMLASKLCGIDAARWRVHQLIALSFLTLALLSFLDHVARLLIRPKAGRFWLKIGLTAPLVFSPLVIEFVSWPFETGQLLWATLTVLCLLLVSQAIIQGANGMVSLRKLSLSLACGYGSLHAFGLGIATMIAWLAVWIILLADGYLGKVPIAYLKKLGWLGTAGVALTAVHGALMFFLPRFRPDPPLGHLGLGSYVAQTLGYAVCLIWECLRSLAGPDAWPYSRPDFLGKDWVYGLGFFLTLVSCGVKWFGSHRTRPSPLSLSRVCWLAFSSVAFGAYAGMVSLRILHQGESWLGYLIGPRYLWPGALLFFGFFAALASCVRFENRWLLAVSALLVSGVCVGSNVVYQQTVIPKIWPWLTISHEQSWWRIGRMVSELQRAGLPIPNLVLNKLGFEYEPSLAQYETLARALAGIRADESMHWLACGSISPALWQEMREKSPALTQLSTDVFAQQESSERQALAAVSEESKPTTPLATPNP